MSMVYNTYFKKIWREAEKLNDLPVDTKSPCQEAGV